MCVMVLLCVCVQSLNSCACAADQRLLSLCLPLSSRLRLAAQSLATLDALQALAATSVSMSARSALCRPHFVDQHARGGALLSASGLQHPCMFSAAAAAAQCVPNDLVLDGCAQAESAVHESVSSGGVQSESNASARAPIALLTGANMGGKTSLMRTAATLVILAQIG
jgi:DNA mismatch repair protein MSH6